MKIEDRLSNYMSLLNSDIAKPAILPNETAGKADLPHDDGINVELSAAASHQSEDNARLEKLNAIRKQLAEGSYNISGKDVANKMIKILTG